MQEYKSSLMYADDNLLLLVDETPEDLHQHGNSILPQWYSGKQRKDTIGRKNYAVIRIPDVEGPEKAK